MSRWRPLPEHEPARAWTPVPKRLARLSALCSRWGFDLRVLECTSRCTTVELSAYGGTWVFGLRDAEFAVAAWVEAEHAEYRARRVAAGYPAELVGS